MRSILRELDILEINYMDTFVLSKRKDWDDVKKSNIVWNVLKILEITVKAVILDFIFLFVNKKIKAKNLFFISTTNQLNALSPIKENLENSLYIGTQRSSENRLFMSVGYLLSIIMTPYFLYTYRRKTKKQRRIIKAGIHNYFFIYGLVIWWKYYLKKTKPDAVFFANDHGLFHRTLRFSAQKASIPTIYIQHAAISATHPKLEFDLALLEGEDSYKKYEKKGEIHNAELIGMPKFDQYYKFINQRTHVERIGICTNPLDPEETIIEICKGLFQFPLSLISYLRPHPADNRKDFYKELSETYNLVISDSNKITSFQFLSNVDLIISGESSMHLEAVLLNVYPIFFRFNNKVYDHYGFIQNNLVTDVFDDSELLFHKITELNFFKPNIRSRAKYYNDTIDTIYDGNSINLAIEKYRQFKAKKTNH